jgi:replicative DNA helicase
MNQPVPPNYDAGAPFSQEAEEAVIGAVLLDPSTFLSIASFLRVDDFFLQRHKKIWEAMLRIHDRKDGIDLITTADELENLRVLDEVGGRSYLLQMLTNVGSSSYAEIYARLVERAAIRRRLLEAADKIRSVAYDETLSIETVISAAEQQIFNVTDQRVKGEFVQLSQALSEYYDRVEQMIQSRSGSPGVPSGFRDLDMLLGGFQKSDLLVFAGRPGMGKTSWLLTSAMNVARLNGCVAIFTMEMGVEQLIQRMVAMESGVNMQKLRLGKLDLNDQARFTEAVGRIANFPIFIDDTPAMSPLEMRNKCRRLKHEFGLDLVIVDYMQLMNAGGSYENNRVQEISYISRSLKEMARELNVPLISAAQLSRAVEQRQDKRPVLSDLRESGSIEQDADIVMFLYRDEVYNEATEFPNQADVIVAKHRNGPTGTISLYFDKALTKFKDVNAHRVDLSDLD